MNPLEALDQNSLLDALTEYYQKYRQAVDEFASEKEFNTCRNSLFAILAELNKRQGYDFDSDLLPRDFKFTREATK